MPPGNTWDRLESLFNQALDLPPAQRLPWLHQQCAPASELCQQVENLLASHENQGDFLQAPMLDFRGQSFGPYTATEEIGRGGMSIVYKGARTDGDFQKHVAIKVVLLQSHAALQYSETQILAALEHHTIARLIDAGATPLGFRYLLMEYVEGKPCTEYAAASNEKQKLRLFLQMCAGVQYAHRSLVVHRDLKPDNILVTADGAVKLLDFGIAKLLTADTRAAQTKGIQAYTPDYASPEQILGQPVTTATDIYSLGVLLCELLSTRRPRSLTGLSNEEIVTRAKTEEITQLPLTGDLAIIARKALRRDPAERYESAGALARDVERYLNGMPIEAREPTWRYRASKFIARNKFAVSAATLAVAGLALATGVAIWQARLAATRFEQVRSLARGVMFEIHDAVKPLPGSLAARKIIVDRSLVYLEALAKDTNADDDVQLDVARGFLRLSDIQGKDYGGASLGNSAEALSLASRAVEVATRVTNRSPRNIEARQVLVDALDSNTTAHTIRGETDKALALAETNIKVATNLPPTLENKDRLATAYKQLAAAYDEKRDYAKSIPAFKQALQLRKELYDATPGDRARLQRLAEANQWLGNSYGHQKDYPNAGVYAKEALRLDELRYLKDPRGARANIASDAVLYSLSERRAGRIDHSVALLRRALAMRQEIAAEDPSSVNAAFRVSTAKERLADALREARQYPEAIRLGEEALQSTRKIQQKDPNNVAANREMVYAHLDLALAYTAINNRTRACALVADLNRFDQPTVKGIHPATDKEIARARALCK
jgi:tetratricopeptide (TPR) repeat protein